MVMEQQAEQFKYIQEMLRIQVSQFQPEIMADIQRQ